MLTAGENVPGPQPRPRGKPRKQVSWDHHSGYAMVGACPVFIELVPETDGKLASPWCVPRAKPARGPWLAAIYSNRFKERMVPLGERMLAVVEGATLPIARAAVIAQLEQLESSADRAAEALPARTGLRRLGSG